jgi:hypothetical protein
MFARRRVADCHPLFLLDWTALGRARVARALIRLENGLYRRLFERQALKLAKGFMEQEAGRTPHRSTSEHLGDTTLIAGR